LRAIRRLLRAARLSEKQLATATGLTPSQLVVLQEVARHGETTAGAIAAKVQFSQATVTSIVDRLAERRFCRPQPPRAGSTAGLGNCDGTRDCGAIVGAGHDAGSVSGPLRAAA
ncbi:MAG TPA: MarR family winged helix-turn-helix transcriptional regulator, partial [Novosphingobium sp.]